ncbi:hypothetical protein M0R19_06740 [Candidatus Pacearchaeota archaeon]|jgi:hypothetical protein|nr:hypothetical protein [Candidatus Pacearchaeota archaeon]
MIKKRGLINNKLGQEEMIGFVLIIVIVTIIILVFLSFSLRKSQNEVVESYQVNGFIQSFLQYTSDCRNDLEYLSVQNLIFSCRDGGTCLDKRDVCKVLNSTLKDIVKESWRVGSGRPIQGYKLDILVNKEGMLMIKEGNETQNYEGSSQDFSRKGEDFEISVIIYY